MMGTTGARSERKSWGSHRLSQRYDRRPGDPNDGDGIGDAEAVGTGGTPQPEALLVGELGSAGQPVGEGARQDADDVGAIADARLMGATMTGWRNLGHEGISLVDWVGFDTPILPGTIPSLHPPRDLTTI